MRTSASANRSLSLAAKEVKRFYVLGKGHSSELRAARTLAKKEIAVYAAIYVRRKEKSLGYERSIPECLAFLFNDYDNGKEWLGVRSNYEQWVSQRARDLTKGSRTVLFAADSFEDHYLFEWEIDDVSIFPNHDYWAEEVKP